MTAPRYRLAQRFVRLEALSSLPADPAARGGPRNEPADPVAMQVRLTLAGDASQIIEEQDAKACSRIYRITTGVWAYEPATELLKPNELYTANFRYQMIGGNLQVIRQNFQFFPVPERPVQPGYAVVFGTLAGLDGLPFSNERVIVESYKDVVSLNQRISTAEVRSDPFGLWWMELPIGTLVRFVLGELSKVITVPNVDRAALAGIESYQPAASTDVDSFGYPKP